MAEPHWTSYVGMLTGICGAILSVISYRKASSVKKLDLRLELRRAVSNLHADISGLAELLPYAKKSRERVAAAKGLARSGAMEQWLATHENDTATLNGLADSIKAYQGDFADLNLAALESKLAALHELQLLANRLLDKYRAGLAADDGDREFLREMARREVNRG
jgi:hypothetical protein